MAFITELLGFIGLDVDEQSFNTADKSILEITKGLGGIIAAAGAVDLTLKGLTFGLVNAFAENAVEVDRMASRLNANADEFQELTYAARQFGIEQDAVADGMKELSMRVAEFSTTGEGSAKDALSQLGISQAQIKGYGNDVTGLFNLIRDKLSQVKEQGQRQFLSDALFGGGLADVGGEFFAQTSESIAELQKQAAESGIIITEDSRKLAKQYTRDIDALTSRIKGLWQILASSLLPVFSAAAKRLKEFLDLNGAGIIEGLTVAVRGLSEAVRYLGIAAAVAAPYLIGSAAIAGWAKLISLVDSLVVSFYTMRTGALLAWAAAAIGPALVGAAILSLILVIQDLYTYFTGGDSITGRIVESFKGMATEIKGVWTDLKAWFGQWFDDFKQKIKDMLPDWLISRLEAGATFANESPLGPVSQRQSSFAVPGQTVVNQTDIQNTSVTNKNDTRNTSVTNRNSTVPPVIQPPSAAVMSAPTTAQGYAQANAGRSSVVTNSGNTTIGDINVTTNQDGSAFAQQFRDNMMKNNATTVKSIDTGVQY